MHRPVARADLKLIRGDDGAVQIVMGGLYRRAKGVAVGQPRSDGRGVGASRPVGIARVDARRAEPCDTLCGDRASLQILPALWPPFISTAFGPIFSSARACVTIWSALSASGWFNRRAATA